MEKIKMFFNKIADFAKKVWGYINSHFWLKPTIVLSLIGIIAISVFVPILTNEKNDNSSSSTNELSSSSSSSSSLGPVSYKLTNKMIDKLNDGYRAEGFYSATVQDTLVSAFYYEYNCTDTVYEYTAYKDDVKNPSKDVIEDSYRYEGYDAGGTLLLTLAKLNLSNEVINYPVTDGYNYLSWEGTGFGNIFSEIKSTYFEAGEKEFEFELKMNDFKLFNIYSALTSQFSSYMGLTAKSFTLITDGYNITSYRMTYQPLQAVSGQMFITVEGNFTKFGSDVVKPVEKFKGIANTKFDNAFAELRNQTYKVDIDLGIKSYTMVVEDGENIVYDEFDKKGNKVSSYGYTEVQSGVLQGVTKINDSIYKDGGYVAGNLVSDILPILNISSELFVLVEETTEKSVFKYNEAAPSIQSIGYNYDYGIFGGSTIGDLTITIKDNEVIIVNDVGHNVETFRYYDINNFNGYFADIKTSDNLKWSEVLSNQEVEIRKLFETIPQEAMDLIPTVGGITSKVTVDASYKPNEPVISVPIHEDIETLYYSYTAKLINSGFEYSEELSDGGKEAYIKECVVGGETRTLVVKIYFAQDYLSGSQFLIYPSLI